MESRAVEDQKIERPERSALNEQARQADTAEHQESIQDAIRGHKKAIFWAFIFSLCVIMEGYDTALLGSFYAYPSFAKKFGKYDPSTKNYQIAARWQTGLNNGSGVGAFLGAILNGFLVDRFGQKKVVLGALFSLSGFIFIVFFSHNVETLLVGEILCGLPWGIFATSSPAYASEVLPLRLRVYMTSWTNSCFVIGQLISSGVLAGMVTVKSEWSYRVPFAVQWFWPAILFPIILFAPESPWYLVRKNRIQEARHSVTRLNRAGTDPETIDAIVSLIIHTDNQEQELLNVSSSYWECFRGVEARRTEIACVAFLGQVTVGGAFAGQSTYFFQQVGLSSLQSYRLNVGGNALALVSTMVSWAFLMPYLGRRAMYLSGFSAIFIILMIIGILNVRTDIPSVGMTQAVLTLVWTVAFQSTIGMMGWALPAEVSSTRLRQKTVVIARNVYYLGGVLAGVLEPYMMNPTAWNWKGYTGLFWAGWAFITLVWAYYRLPESKGRSNEELNLLFAERVPARRFKQYQVDVFNEHEEAKVAVEQVED